MASIALTPLSHDLTAPSLSASWKADLTCQQNPKTLSLGIEIIRYARYYDASGNTLNLAGQIVGADDWPLVHTVATLSGNSPSPTPLTRTLATSDQAEIALRDMAPVNAVSASYFYKSKATGTGASPCSCTKTDTKSGDPATFTL